MAGTASYAVTELAFPLAEEKGYFAQAGLKIQSTSTEQTASALASGSVDVAIGSPGSLVGGLNKGLNITIIGGVSDEFAETWAVRPSLNITSLSQLKGKKLGISSSGSAGDLSISLLAKHFGWGPNDFTRVSLGGLDGILAGMKSGAIDAFAWPPIATFELQAQGEAKVLIDNFPKIVGDLPVDVIAVSTKTLDSRPKAVKAFCTAFYKASALLKKDPSAGISPEVKGGDRKNGPALLKALQFGAPLLSTNGTLSDQAMKNIVEAAQLTTQGAQSLTVDVLKQHYKPCESI